MDKFKIFIEVYGQRRINSHESLRKKGGLMVLILINFLMHSFTAQALDLNNPAPVPATKISLACVSEPQATSFGFQSGQDGRLHVTVINHLGVDSMPIHYGIVTPYDLPKLAAKAEVLKKLGEQFELYWSLKNCKSRGPKLFECFGGGETTNINGMVVEPYSIYTTRITSEGPSGIYERINVNVDLTIDKKTYKFSNTYSEKECWLTADR